MKSKIVMRVMMNHYLILHEGYEKPTLQDMEAWKKWFGFIADKLVERGGLRGGRQFKKSGMKDLPFGRNPLTGYTIIQANSLEDAKKIARECPIAASTRVYESHK